MDKTGGCSSNTACACFRMAAPSNASICTDEFMMSCSELVPCHGSNYLCNEPDYKCIYHLQCRDVPVCYPVPIFNEQLCPPIGTTTTATTPNAFTTQQRIIPNIPQNATWIQNANTVAGGNSLGAGTHQLNHPFGIFVDEDQTVIVTGWCNHRITLWKSGLNKGGVIAGGNGVGNRLDQLNWPTDVLYDKETESFIICDKDNRRVMEKSRRNGTSQGKILISNIGCFGLAMDDHRYLYVSDIQNHEVRRFQIGGENGTLVAGGNGKGTALNQLSEPHYLFVDQQQNLYVADYGNHRVMKWNMGALEGVVVAGGQGTAVTQLWHPQGLFVDTLGTLYVADSWNNRIMRWPQGARQGTLIAGGHGSGSGANQFRHPIGLSFDKAGNIYVVDNENHRVQRFSLA